MQPWPLLWVAVSTCELNSWVQNATARHNGKNSLRPLRQRSRRKAAEMIAHGRISLAPPAAARCITAKGLGGVEVGSTYESTNLSRFTHLGFLGLNFMNLLKRTCETGAMPMGAPGWPELAFAVASTCERARGQHWRLSQRVAGLGGAASAGGRVLRSYGGAAIRAATYGQRPDGVDGKLINLSVRHDGQIDSEEGGGKGGWRGMNGCGRSDEEKHLRAGGGRKVMQQVGRQAAVRAHTPLALVETRDRDKARLNR